MTKKICTIRLMHRLTDNNESYYLVMQVTDSLSFNPGMTIKPRDVQTLINSPYWKVTIVGSN
jgi:hypothetical protein